MADKGNQQGGPDSAPANDDLASRAEEARYARRTSTSFGVAAGIVALTGIAAGITQHGTLALWCAPLFALLGVIANHANENARQLTKGASEPQSLARQAGEGVLLAVLALLFLVVIFFVWLFKCWWVC
ncbi:MAG TPA: hypothetical protein VF836_03485 [Gemmatimonadaceae bacterium]